MRLFAFILWLAVLGLHSGAGLKHTYGWHAGTGRLNTVSNGLHSVVYGYLPSSDLVSSLSFRSNATTRATTSKTWDLGYRLRSIATATTGGGTISSHYHYCDDLDRRTSATLRDGSYWSYDYNDRSELTIGKRHWEDYSPVAGQQYAFNYDPIGNRTASWDGGNEAGGNLRLTGYAVNGLNQYTAVTNAPQVQITGAATATATVKVNGNAAQERGEYYHAELNALGANPARYNVAAIAELSGVSATNSGSLLLPPAAQALTYDADGNLTNDRIWTYHWDGENRLRSMVMTNVSGVPNSNRWKLDFTYDFMGRRVAKVVSSWNGSTFIPQSTNRYVYDGWNLLTRITRRRLSNVTTGIKGMALMWLIGLATSSGGEATFVKYDLLSCHWSSKEGGRNR